MRTLFLLLTLGFLLGLSPLKAQKEGFNRVYHFPPQSEAFAKTVLELDSSYLVQGVADTNLLNNWGRTLMLYKLDRSGDTLSTSKLVGGGVHDYWGGDFEHLIKAPDSGYYMVGNFEDTSDYSSALFFRIGPDLDTMWTRSYGGSDTLWDKFSGIEPLADGNYLIFGQKGNTTAWFLKVDPKEKSDRGQSWRKVQFIFRGTDL